MSPVEMIPEGFPAACPHWTVRIYHESTRYRIGASKESPNFATRCRLSYRVGEGCPIILCAAYSYASCCILLCSSHGDGRQCNGDLQHTSCTAVHHSIYTGVIVLLVLLVLVLQQYCSTIRSTAVFHFDTLGQYSFAYVVAPWSSRVCPLYYQAPGVLYFEAIGYTPGTRENFRAEPFIVGGVHAPSTSAVALAYSYCCRTIVSPPRNKQFVVYLLRPLYFPHQPPVVNKMFQVSVKKVLLLQVAPLTKFYRYYWQLYVWQKPPACLL